MRKITAALLALLAVAGAARAAAPAPAEHYARSPLIHDAIVSPSGKRLALLVGGNDGRTRLGVMSIETPGDMRVVAAYADSDVQHVHWVNENRLVYDAVQADVAVVDPGKAGTFAVDFDGSQPRTLIAWVRAVGSTGTNIASRTLPYGWFVHSTLDDGSDDVLVVRRKVDNRGNFESIAPARLNTRTGELRNLAYGMPPGTTAFWNDARHEPRALVAEREGREYVHWRPSPDAPWSEVAAFELHADPNFVPWKVEDDGSLLVMASRNGYAGLYRFDPAARRLDAEPRVALTGYDLDPVAEVDSRSGRLLGIHFVVDRPMSYWFDDALGKLQRGIDAALPGRDNRLYCGRCESTRWFVVRSQSDRQPGEFFLFDREKGQLSRIGTAMPWLDEAAQGRRSMHRVKTRDGLDMPLYVTHPPGARDDEALPAVVLVHGGPWVRDSSLAWEAEAQFLASRGYRVLQPQFRGTPGFGWAHFHAGWKAWGGRMQDDLVDALEWAAARHWIDRGRVCIMGASYGGYAALMAPIVHPQAFRCAVAHAAVTDIALMYDIAWSDITEAARRHSMPVLIGDPDKDKALLERASPLKRVAELKIPVLLVHGGEDRRVPIEHARRFARAAEGAGVKVEKVEYPDEGHGWFNPAHRTDYFQRVERFLAQSLQP